jgi:hypothetical protein
MPPSAAHFTSKWPKPSHRRLNGGLPCCSVPVSTARWSASGAKSLPMERRRQRKKKKNKKNKSPHARTKKIRQGASEVINLE